MPDGTRSARLRGLSASVEEDACVILTVACKSHHRQIEVRSPFASAATAEGRVAGAGTSKRKEDQWPS